MIAQGCRTRCVEWLMESDGSTVLLNALNAISVCATSRDYIIQS
jgi:hypothetical protein